MSGAARRHLLEGEQAGLRYALGLPRHAPLGSLGTALTRRTGSSLEFREYRDYEPGDDLRHIDWGAYARSDHLFVKQFREEAHPHLDLVLDGSRSMDLEGSAKARAAWGLAGFFYAAAANAGYTCSAWVLGGHAVPVAAGGGGPRAWEVGEFTFRGSPVESFRHAPPGWRPRGMRVLVSDLLWEGDPEAAVSHLADRASTVVVVQLLARADVDPPEGNSLRLVDAETDQVMELYIDALAARRYREALARHQQNWNRACRQVGAVFTTVAAEDLVRDWRLDDLVAAEVLKVV
jgi:uncharacterized protein (DUF58 family)